MILKEPVKLMKKWRLVHLPRKEVRKAQSEDRVITLGSFQLWSYSGAFIRNDTYPTAHSLLKSVLEVTQEAESY